MEKLKTLKDIESEDGIIAGGYGEGRLINDYNIRQEAIKWVRSIDNFEKTYQEIS